MDHSQCTIVAGPCSIDEHNIREVRTIADMEVKNRSGKHQRAVAGTRIVGLKSRTELVDDRGSMGIDYDSLMKNLDMLVNGGTKHDFEIPPSALVAEDIVSKTDLLVATEVMMPGLQLPAYEGRIPAGKLMPWNPSVNQLGWQVREMASFAKRNRWKIGLKNGKWIGEPLKAVDSQDFGGRTSMEKTWTGLGSYAAGCATDIVLIHRGVDVDGKGLFRNLPVHNIAVRAKRQAGAALYFDPSHTYGPQLRHEIVDATVAAMALTDRNGNYVYDGVLIEVGTSKTDTAQHITVKELETLVQRIAVFRDLETPEVGDGTHMKQFAW